MVSLHETSGVHRHSVLHGLRHRTMGAVWRRGGHPRRSVGRRALAYAVQLQGATPGMGQEFSSPHKTIDHGQVARHIERVYAYHRRFPGGDYLVHLHFSIGVRVQLEDAIDRNSVPVAPGAVLSWSIEVSVVLENPPCRPGRANIALYRVGTMRSPGPQRRIGVEEVEFPRSSGTRDRNAGEQPPLAKHERWCGI